MGPVGPAGAAGPAGPAGSAGTNALLNATAVFTSGPGGASVTGALPVSGTFTTAGGAVVILASGSAYASGGGTIGLTVLVDDVARGELRSYTNEGSSHKALVSSGIVVRSLGAGTHTLTFQALGGTLSDINDYFSATVLEYR